jgi:hypothetical protein
MKRYLFVSILFLLLLSTPSLAQDSFGSFLLDVEGSAAINHNDVAGARDEAIQDALLKAVLQAASKLLSIPVKDRRFEPVTNALSEQPDKYVINYKISAEKNQAEVYLVHTRVTLALSVLNSDLHRMGFIRATKVDKTDIILLDVRGVRKYSDFLYLKEFLKNQAGIVKNINQRSFAWQQVHLELEISGTAQAFAGELARTGRYILDTREINKNQIQITFLPRGGE